MNARITNCHNTHLHSPYNPQPFHCIQLPIHFFGEHGNQKLGTLIFAGSVTEDMHFLQDKLPFILEDVCPQVILNVWLQHDVAPPHFH